MLRNNIVLEEIYHCMHLVYLWIILYRRIAGNNIFQGKKWVLLSGKYGKLMKEN
jgi:hypothetical protein